MTAYYSDDYLTLLQGDAAQTLATLPTESSQACVTSPPYYGLRDYGTGEAQIGLEASPAEYVTRLVEVFREVRRVLRNDGTLWLNLGDSYAYPPGSAGRQGNGQRSDRTFTAEGLPGTRALPPKNLLGIPWRVALALQADGWILRNAIVWDKPNPMPESVTDRLSSTYEVVFLLAVSQRYWFDLDAIREPQSQATIERLASGPAGVRRVTPGETRPPRALSELTKGRNPGDVWTISTTPYPCAHFAVMPPEMARRCIAAGSREGDTVLDPFIGSGTTAMVANHNGRRAVGIDLSEEYLAQAMRRCKDAPLAFGEEAS